MNHREAWEWMMEPRARDGMLARSASLPIVARADAEAAEAAIRSAMSGDPYDPSSPCCAQRVGDGAVLPIAGPLYHGQSWWMDMLGGLSYQLVVARIEALRRDASVKWVIGDFNSPGGSMAGVKELFDAIKAFATGARFSVRVTSETQPRSNGGGDRRGDGDFGGSYGSSEDPDIPFSVLGRRREF